jgi:putative adhesin
MRTTGRIAVLAVLCAAAPSLAFAQRFAFERTIQTTGPTRLDVSTDRGKIEVVAGRPGRVVVEGAATVRVGWNVPANAVELAKKVAATPPIEYADQTVRLRIPADPAAQQAVIVNYRVEVPPGTEVRTRTDSGATSIRGVDGTVDIRTQSSAIDVADVSGAVQIATGSGAVRASDVLGALSVSTSSSAIRLSALGSSLKARTQSGEINADLRGTGDVDVETGSSAINLQGVRGGLAVRTQSGRVNVQGAPTRDWKATTGSSNVRLDLESTTGFVLDAVTRSSHIDMTGVSVNGSVTKQTAKGTVGNGGPTVMVRTGNGQIHIGR